MSGAHEFSVPGQPGRMRSGPSGMRRRVRLAPACASVSPRSSRGSGRPSGTWSVPRTARGGGRGRAPLLVLPECGSPGLHVRQRRGGTRRSRRRSPGPFVDGARAPRAPPRHPRRLRAPRAGGRRAPQRRRARGPDGLVGTVPQEPSAVPRRRPLRSRRATRSSVFETPLGRIGIEICYDLRFPEATRTLALQGADIVAHPTNWPVAARSNAELITRRPRAREPGLPADGEPRRQGAQRGVLRLEPDRRPAGTRLAEADATGEALLVAEVDVA